jgi:ABC-type transport system substrate-binding protein
MMPLLGIVIMLALAACEGRSQSAAETQGYLRLAEADDLPTLDPALGYDTASWQFEEMLFNTLVDYDDDGRIVPELAERWEVSPDGRTWTFSLRQDARFSNGRPVTAEDVRFAIERVVAPPTRSPGAEFFRGIEGAEACVDSPCRITGIATPDTFTLRITLREVDPLFLHKLAMPFAAAVPAEEVARWGEDFARHPVGSGPYVLEEWRPGQRVVVRRNPDYFLPGVPRLAGILRLVGVNDQLEWLKYESGEIDVATIPPAEFLTVTRAPQYRDLIHQETTLRTQYVGLNTRLPPFTDRRVRQALNYAIDKRKLLRLINQRGVVARGVVPPNMPGYATRVQGYDFDPERARALLREAGYADGFSTTLWLRLDDTTLRLAQSIQQDLAAVGVRVQLKPLAWGPFLEAVRSGELAPMFLLGWEADFPDPSNFLEVLFHSKHIGSNNNTNYQDPAVDAKLDAAGRTLDPKTREDLLHDAEEHIVADAPWIILYHPVSYRIVNQRVRGFHLHPFRPERHERTWVADGS